MVLAGIVVLPVLAVGGVIASVKGKERLAEAKEIHAEAMCAATKLDIMTTGMSGIEKMSDNYRQFIQEFSRKFKPFVKEMQRIRDNHPLGDDGLIDFNELSTVEQKTLHLAWLMAQIYYHVLSAPILTAEGEASPEAEKIITTAENEFKQLKRDTFKMAGDDAIAANILWNEPARSMMVVNFIAIAIMITVGIIIFERNILGGIALFIAAGIAFPVFVKYKVQSASRLLVLRIVRLIVAILFIGLLFRVLY